MKRVYDHFALITINNNCDITTFFWLKRGPVRGFW